MYENVTLDPYGEIQQKGRRGHGVTDVSLCDTATTIVSVMHATSVMGWTVSPEKRYVEILIIMPSKAPSGWDSCPDSPVFDELESFEEC